MDPTRAPGTINTKETAVSVFSPPYQTLEGEKCLLRVDIGVPRGERKRESFAVSEIGSGRGERESFALYEIGNGANDKNLLVGSDES